MGIILEDGTWLTHDPITGEIVHITGEDQEKFHFKRLHTALDRLSEQAQEAAPELSSPETTKETD